MFVIYRLLKSDMPVYKCSSNTPSMEVKEPFVLSLRCFTFYTKMDLARVAYILKIYRNICLPVRHKINYDENRAKIWYETQHILRFLCVHV